MSVAGLAGPPFICKTKGKLAVIPEEGFRPCVLKDVYISEHFPATFVSESVLTQAGCSVLKKGSGGMVADADEEPVFKITQKGGLYFIKGAVVMPSSGALAKFRRALAGEKSRKYPRDTQKCPTLPTCHRSILRLSVKAKEQFI
jgi:hypothetical protein